MSTLNNTRDLKTAATQYFRDFPETENYNISWENMLYLLDMKKNLFILSIVSKQDYKANHIKGSYHAEFGVDLATKLSSLPKNKPVFIYCETGQKSSQAVVLLRILGINAFSIYSGSIYGEILNRPLYFESKENVLTDLLTKFNNESLEFVTAYLKNVIKHDDYIISPNKALSLLDSKEVAFIDIRRSEDYKISHIDNSINIPFGRGMEKHFETLPKKKLVVICYSGQTSGQTIVILNALGHQAVSLEFGMHEQRPGWGYFNS